MAHKDDKNLPALPSTTFLMPAPKMEIDPALLAEITSADMEGFSTPRDVLPIVSIRQKEVRSENGRTVLIPAGGFKMYDSVAKALETNVQDVEGDLIVSLLRDQDGRTYWKDLDAAKPDCKSINGKIGVGNPGGQCIDSQGLPVCPKAQWTKHPDTGADIRPECSAEVNLLAYDHTLQSCYVLRLGRSGIKPYSDFKKLVARGIKGQQIPLPFLKVRISTRYETEPQPHFVPRFGIEGAIDKPTLDKFRILREDQSVLAKTAEVVTEDEEHPKVHTGKVTVPGASELPDDVTPISNDNAGQDDLPF